MRKKVATNNRALSFVDEITGFLVKAGHPEALPELWMAYREAAHERYAFHGVGDVISVPKNPRNDDEIFWSVLDGSTTVGGVRAVAVSSQSPSQTQLNLMDHPNRLTLDALIEQRVIAGIVEGTTAFVARSHNAIDGLSEILARCILHSISVLGCRYLVGCSADHSLPLWSSTGAEIMREIAPFPYPDGRYRTSVIWWDIETFAERGHPEQVKRVCAEADQLEILTNAQLSAF